MIEYSTDNGNTWSTIVSAAGNRGTYEWTIPDTVSDECLVRVSANDGAGDPRPTDVSDEVFSIALPSSPTIRVLTPNGGEQLMIGTRYEITWFGTDTRAEVKIEYSLNGGESLSAGEEYYITWASSGVNNVIIEYSTDNGEQWIPIDTVPAIGGRFTWTVPSTPSDSCLIRISGNTPGDDPFDVSDEVFSIIAI